MFKDDKLQLKLIWRATRHAKAHRTDEYINWLKSQGKQEQVASVIEEYQRFGVSEGSYCKVVFIVCDSNEEKLYVLSEEPLNRKKIFERELIKIEEGIYRLETCAYLK